MELQTNKLAYSKYCNSLSGSLVDCLQICYPCTSREPFEYMYHSTNMKYQIVRSGVIAEDTHFCCTLLHQEIPDKLAYYGNYRVMVDVQGVLGNFFEDPRLYFICSSKQRKVNCNIWYHNLLLADSYQKGLTYLDMEDNGLLILDLDCNNFLVKKNNSGDFIRVRNRIIPEYHWSTYRWNRKST